MAETPKTKMEERQAIIELYDDPKILNIPYTSKTTSEQIVISICKQLSIGPLTRHLFALRINSTNTKEKYWLPLNASLVHPRYEFRIRYKIDNLTKLKKTDLKAYDYYFQQARHDVRSYCITDINYDTVKRELIGLGVTDMYRALVEKNLQVENVLDDYKKFISKEVLKHHKFFIKKPIRDSLMAIVKHGHDAWFVKGEYLNGLNAMAPEYLTEEYTVIMETDGVAKRVCVRVSPYHKDYPGIRICNAIESPNQKIEWEHISSIEDLCFISISKEGIVEISRKEGIPTYLKFDSAIATDSFVSLLDGYYRLMVKWTFNLCVGITTPSLRQLHELKCHGPVG